MKLIDVLNDLKNECDKKNKIIDKKIQEIEETNNQIIIHNSNLDKKNKIISYKRKGAIIGSFILLITGLVLAFKIPGFFNNMFDTILNPDVSIVTEELALRNFAAVICTIVGEVVAIGSPIAAFFGTGKYLFGKGEYLSEKKLIENPKLELNKKKNNDVKKGIDNAINYIIKLGKEKALEMPVSFRSQDIYEMYNWIYNIKEYPVFDKFELAKEDIEKYGVLSICYVSFSESSSNNFDGLTVESQEKIIKKVCQVIKAASIKMQNDKKNNNKERVRRADRYNEEETTKKK